MTQNESEQLWEIISKTDLANTYAVYEHVAALVNEFIEQHAGEAYDCGVRDGREDRS